MPFLMNRVGTNEIIEVSVLQGDALGHAHSWTTDKGVFDKLQWVEVFGVKGRHIFWNITNPDLDLDAWILEEDDDKWKTNRGWIMKSSWRRSEETYKFLESGHDQQSAEYKGGNMLPTPPKIADAMDAIVREYSRSRKKFPAFHSRHESYAVLLEEVDELWEEIKHPIGQGGAKDEAIQVAAMALAFILEVCE